MRANFRNALSAVAAAMASAFSGCGASEARDGPGASSPLACALSLPDRPFATGDAVPLGITLRNPGPASVLVNARMLIAPSAAARDVVLTVVGPDARPLSPRAWVLLDPLALARARWTTLAAGESVATTFDLASLYD